MPRTGLASVIADPIGLPPPRWKISRTEQLSLFTGAHPYVAYANVSLDPDGRINYEEAERWFGKDGCLCGRPD